MSKIKVISVAINSVDRLTIVDSEGRVWYQDHNMGWGQVELPDEPQVSTESVEQETPEPLDFTVSEN